MWFPEWRVLVVDDEPDVLKLSELVLRNMEVDGVPVRVYTAASKAEALKVIQEHLSEPMGPGLLTVALIDVVMETDTAGLELCDFIRNTMHNSFAQLYIRTGQPGIAPEREVIDRYDISGYFTKVEATEDKLYTMVKSGVRQYLLTSFSMVNTMMLNDFIATSVVSQEHMAASMTEKLTVLATQRGGVDSGTAIWVADVPVTSVGYEQSEAEIRRQRLLKGTPVPLGPMGETIIVDSENHEALIQIPAGPANPPVVFLGSGHSLPKTEFIYMLLAWSMRSLGTLWEAAGQRVPQQ